MTKKTLLLPLIAATFLSGCLAPPPAAPEAPAEPVLDADGVEVLPTDEVIGEDELNA